MQRLAGKVAIVTGAGQGIGEAIARRFAREGADVVVAEIDRTVGEATAEAIAKDTGTRTTFLHTDVTDTQSVAAMVAQPARMLGAPDILVNNAGIAVFGDPLEITDADWARCMSVDLDGVWRCCRTVLPLMLDKRHGAIVNIVSNHAFQVMKQTFPTPSPSTGSWVSRGRWRSNMPTRASS